MPFVDFVRRLPALGRALPGSRARQYQPKRIAEEVLPIVHLLGPLHRHDEAQQVLVTSVAALSPIADLGPVPLGEAWYVEALSLYHDGGGVAANSALALFLRNANAGLAACVFNSNFTAAGSLVAPNDVFPLERPVIIPANCFLRAQATGNGVNNFTLKLDASYVRFLQGETPPGL